MIRKMKFASKAIQMKREKKIQNGLRMRKEQIAQGQLPQLSRDDSSSVSDKCKEILKLVSLLKDKTTRRVLKVDKVAPRGRCMKPSRTV